MTGPVAGTMSWLLELPGLHPELRCQQEGPEQHDRPFATQIAATAHNSHEVRDWGISSCGVGKTHAKARGTKPLLNQDSKQQGSGFNVSVK
eukprot:1267418-Amphidinium_carterae.1